MFELVFPVPEEGELAGDLHPANYLACCQAMQFVPFLTFKMTLSWMPKVVPQKV